MKQRAVIAVLLALCLLCGLAACSGGEKEEKLLAMTDLKADTASHQLPIGYQLELPEKGEEIAVITTNQGVMKMRFFDAAAPKAVYNFKALAKQGFFDGQTFYRVMNDFMIQTGSGTGTNAGGASIWNEAFIDEFAPNLLNIRGSVAMANAGANTNGSQFFINQARPSAFYGWEYFETVYEGYYKGNLEAANAYIGSFVNTDKMPEEAKALYTTQGGNPTLDGWYSTTGKGHTVFGQVFEGLDVLDAIAGTQTDANDKPLTDMVIESVKIVKYE